MTPIAQWIEYFQQQEEKISQSKLDPEVLDKVMALWQQLEFPLAGKNSEHIDYIQEQCAKLVDALIRLGEGKGEKGVWRALDRATSIYNKMRDEDATVSSILSHVVSNAMLIGIRHKLARRRKRQGPALERQECGQANPEDLSWALARMQQAGMRDIRATPAARGRNWQVAAEEMHRLKHSLQVNEQAMTCGRRISLVLSGSSVQQTTAGRWCSGDQSIYLYRHMDALFTHEWMHAIDCIAKRYRSHEMGPLRQAIRTCKSKLRRVQSAPDENAYFLDIFHTNVHSLLESVADDLMGDFLKERADAIKAKDLLDTNGSTYQAWRDQLIVEAMEGGPNCTKNFIAAFECLLPDGAKPINPRGASDFIGIARQCANLLDKKRQECGAVELYGQLHDLMGGKHYWSKSSEIFARAGESVLMRHESHLDNWYYHQGQALDAVKDYFKPVIEVLRKLYPQNEISMGGLPLPRRKMRC